MLIQRWLLVLASVAALLSSAVVGPRYASAQAGCAFQLGFKSLHDQIPAIVGDCITDEYHNPDNGDGLQQTTGGLLVWRKADNWTAFTDGGTTWLSGPCGLQSRPNQGPFLPWEGQPGAGCPSTPLSAQPPAASGPGRDVFPVMEAPAAELKLPCLTANPSCGRDPWWAEWNDLQRANPVNYAFLGPGFATEYRFVEAIWLLWQWSDGKALLRDAATHGVKVVAAPFGVAALAAYRPLDRTVYVNQQYTAASTWMLTDLIAHELKHASDDRAGLRSGQSYADCIAREQAAYQVEAQYLRWVAARFGGLPSPNTVQARLSAADYDLYLNLYHIGASSNVDATALEDYRKACAV